MHCYTKAKWYNKITIRSKAITLETKEYLKIKIHKFFPVYLQILQVMAMQNEEHSNIKFVFLYGLNTLVLFCF